MSSRKPTRRRDTPPCADWREDDGIDPRMFAERRAPGRGRERTVLRLCSQVAECLRWSLGESCSDPRIAELEIEGVVPAPDAGRLRIEVVVHGDLSEEMAQGLLSSALPRLRSAVAAYVQRRRVPDLAFSVRREVRP